MTHLIFSDTIPHIARCTIIPMKVVSWIDLVDFLFKYKRIATKAAWLDNKWQTLVLRTRIAMSTRFSLISVCIGGKIGMKIRFI